jgi:predicted ATPase
VTAGLVADQLRKDTRLLYRGRRVLRGIERPEEVWELVAADDPRLAAISSARVGRLPVAQTRFVGREGDVDHLAQLVEDERLVTLTGPGGSGKTRLAIELARHATRRGDVVWLAELASLRDGGLVAQSVAAAVGVETGPDPLDDLLARAEALAGLLVLDNCEHLLGACVVLIERLLGAAPDIRILATSREPLGLAGEQEWPVRSLDVPDASLRDRGRLARVESVQLLLDRARAVRPELDVGDDDVPAVVQIGRSLDGIPLAVELAAGRLRSLSFADLAVRLGDQVSVLARRRSPGRRDPRHQTMRMTLDWSYDLLTVDQQTLARRLSVFAGSFRLDAVEAVCGGAIDVLDGIDELVAKSVVTFDGMTARYRLLEPVRQYLAERLENTGGTEVVREAHAEWVAGLCDRLGSRLLEDQERRSIRLREESENVDLALRWALDHRNGAVALGIVGSLGQYWFFNDQDSGRRWCAEFVDAVPGAAPRRRAKALLSVGIVAQHDDDWDRSITSIRAALAIYRADQVVAGEAASLYWLGRALDERACDMRRHVDNPGDDASEAAHCFEECLRLSTQLGDWISIGWCRIWLSFQAFRDEDLDRAEQLSHQIVEECSAAGARHPAGQALRNLAVIAHRRCQHDAALDFIRQAVAIFRDLDDRWSLAVTLGELAAQAAVAGVGPTDFVHWSNRHGSTSRSADSQGGRTCSRSRRSYTRLVARRRCRPRRWAPSTRIPPEVLSGQLEDLLRGRAGWQARSRRRELGSTPPRWLPPQQQPATRASTNSSTS